MASSRESSPALGSNAASLGQLTPTAKVRALLANFDKDSDSESDPGLARQRVAAALTSTTLKPKDSVDQTGHFDTRYQSPTKQDIGATDDDEEGDIVRPKGRLAARMHVNPASSDEDAPPTSNARERVRRMLLARSKGPKPALSAGAANVSDESDAPAISRKRKVRTSRLDTLRSSPINRASSHKLSASPSRSTHTDSEANSSHSDALPASLPNDDRFKALVQKKREERLAREAEAAKEEARKFAERNKHAKLLEDDEDELSDTIVEKRLTQPIRKAGKKAQEEIRRETQRLSRNQQLAHNATTKRKYGKADLFATFNFRQDYEGPPELPRPVNSSSPAPHHSDTEMKDTPPTSPASDAGTQKVRGSNELPVVENGAQNLNIVEHLPALEHVLSRRSPSPSTRKGKGKVMAIEQTTLAPQIHRQKTEFIQQPIRVRPPKITGSKSLLADDSDSDLEIMSAKTPNGKMKKLNSIFDGVPAMKARETHSIHALRILAHVTSPGRKVPDRNKKPSINTAELQTSLQQRAKQQAKIEREERLKDLRDKGIIVQTAEERQMEMAEVEDLISKARREAEEISKREKAAAKKERKERGEEDPLGDSSDDADWEEGKGGEEEPSASGSEEDEEVLDEEEDEDEDEEDEGQESATLNPIFDPEAVDDQEETEADLAIIDELAEDADVDEEAHQPHITQKQRRNRKAIISDDEDEDEEEGSMHPPREPLIESPVQLCGDSPRAPNSVLRSATKTFIPGVTVAGPAGLGLTQIFAGTMDDSQLEVEELSSTVRPTLGSQLNNSQESLAVSRGFPAPKLSPFVPTIGEDTQDQDMVMDSQSTTLQHPELVSQEVDLRFTQSQIHGFDSLIEDSQLSQLPDATQDVGFQAMTPVRGRFVDAPSSTVDTVVLAPTTMPETTDETPIVKKKGKLRQRARIAIFSDEEDNGDAQELHQDEDEFEITATAFDVMRKATKKKIIVDEFDKKNSKAKDMVNEQAQESEDEYAGLGGASDDESGEEDAFAKDMIDDEGGKNGDASKLAAFFADRERVSDEKEVEKLYKDITNGMLRRKRGADYDLSDSDDGGEARRNRKRAEFAKMRKALLADERIGKIANNPKRQAFLRAIEDRGSGDEIDFLEDFTEHGDGTDTQSQSQGESSQLVVQDSQPIATLPVKRKQSDELPNAESRAPPYLRRTNPNKKPANISEIRESLSSLIDEPNAMIAPVESSSESDNELEIEGYPGAHTEKENEICDPFAARRTKVPVIDRISLKRASSSSVSVNTRLAFATSSAVPGFKVPALLRRATTNSSLGSSTSSSTTGGMSATERMAAAGGSDGVKRGGGKNSGVHYFARERERRSVVENTEKRRELKLIKAAEGRRKVVGELFSGGNFE